MSYRVICMVYNQKTTIFIATQVIISYTYL
nr:MAG TPA: hypothetical protein [Caudoviricetes sp.]